MSLLKSYTCSSCAGVLMFDYDQEFFDCPFCGTTFNAVDFHEEEFVAQAEENLRKLAFSSAKEKFNFILENNPSDFEALKGLILCEISTSSLESLNTPCIFDSVDIISLKNLVARLKKQASFKDYVFFDQLLNLVDLADRLKMYQNNINSLYDADTRAEINQTFIELEQRKHADTNYNKYFGPAIVLGSIAFGALFSFTGNFEIVFIVSMLAMLIGTIVWAINADYHKPREIYDNPLHNAWEMKGYLEKQYANYEEEYNKEYEKLMELNQASITREPDEAVPEETKAETNITDADLAETVICSKCAGQLYLDKERRVYECRSCGVAYGISLFFGMPMEKALTSMNTGHYGEALKRFENILMVNPSSFDALLGRILCAGRWTRISDIDTSDVINEEDWLKITDRISEARQHVSESDRGFLDRLEELVFLLGKICLNNGNIDELNRKVEALDSMSHLNYLAEKLSTDSSGLSMGRTKLLSDIEKLKKETRQIAHQFLAIKRELIQKKPDCILVK